MAELQLIKKDRQDPPIIAVFPAGVPSVVCDQTDFPFQYFAPADSKKNQGSYLYGESDNLRFHGSTHENFNFAKNDFNFSIGYFDPKRPQKVKLVNAHGTFVIHQTSTTDVNGPDDGSIKALDYNQVRRDVTEQFGARKNKRQLRSQEAGRVNIEADAAALQALDTQLSAIEGDSSHEQVLLSVESNILATLKKLLPRFNLEATNVENSYPFDAMLPRHLWKSLAAPSLLALRLDAKPQKAPKKETTKKSKKSTMSDDDSDGDDELFDESGSESDSASAENKNDDDDDDDDETESTLILSVADQQLVAALPAFIQTRRATLASQIRSAQASNNPQQKAIILQRITQLGWFYILYKIIKHKRGLRAAGVKVSDVLGVSDDIASYIRLTLFRGSLEATEETSMRLLCWFAVMALHCSDSFTIDPSYIKQMAEALQQPSVALHKVFTHIGASVTAAGKVKLTAPLKLAGPQKPHKARK